MKDYSQAQKKANIKEDYSKTHRPRTKSRGDEPLKNSPDSLPGPVRVARGAEQPERTVINGNIAGYLKYGEGGTFGKLQMKDRRKRKKTDRKRGTITGFTKAARRRFTEALGTIDQRLIDPEKILFVTLTYPGMYSEDSRRWKRDLETLRKRMEKKYGKQGLYWKLEFQRRGAPHYHLLIVAGETKIPLRAIQEWYSKAWYEVVGSGDERHLRAGTQVKKANSWRAIVSYGLKYIGKVSQNNGESVGRIWGCRNADLIPRTLVIRKIDPEK